MATSLLKFSLKTNLIKSIISEIVSNVSRYYYTFGRSGPWSNDNAPEAVSDSFEYENEARNEILFYKKIDANDVCAIIPRIDWVSGYTFDMYDEYSSDNPAFSGATALENAEFYCLTDDFNVYKCLYNNENKPSSKRPEGTSTTPIILEDGYIWKYMYTIPLSVRNKFLTATSMPVVTALSNQFYSKGSIVSYTIENPGKKYPQANYKIVGLKIVDAGSGYDIAPTITIAAPDSTGGSGTTATVALVTIDGGVVTSTTMGIQGSGYRYQPTITVTGGGTVNRHAVFEPVLERLGDVYTTLKITGDGYLEENPYEVQSIQVVSGGSGYASGTLFFKDPDLPNGVKPVATAVVSDVQVGVSTQYTNSSTSGTTIAGTFTQQIYPNQYVKVAVSTTTALANTTVTNSQVTGATITNGGFGYDNPPTVTIASPNVTATAKVNFSPLDGSISYMYDLTPGSGYDNPPTVTISPPSGISSIAGPTNVPATARVVRVVNGVITKIIVTNGSFGYDNPPTVTISDPTGVNATATATIGLNGTIDDIVITNGGSGYANTPTVTISPLGENGSAGLVVPYVENHKIVQLYVLNSGYGYLFDQVNTTDGTVTISPPTGTTATATATVTNNTVTGIVITNGGSNYSSSDLPGIAISAPIDPSNIIHKVVSVVNSNIPAAATATITNGKISSITINQGGFGYTAPPSVTIAEPASGVAATAIATVANGQVTSIILTGNSPSEIGGSGYITPPQITISGPQSLDSTKSITLATSIGSRPNTGSIIKMAGAITGFNVTNPGYGYSKPFFSNFESPNATNIVLANTTAISSTVDNGIGGTEPIDRSGLNFKVVTKRNEAELLPIINTNGEIEAIQIAKPGLGYTYAIVDVETSIDPDNDGVVQGEPEFEKASILLNFGIGDIESRQSTVELTAIPGAIHVIKVDNPGFGYTSPPTITVVGDGAGCTATAILNSNSGVDRIQVTNIGSGYTKASIIITGISSVTATARAVISPKGGHGKDAVGELYSKTVVFHTNLSKEKNQGFISTNDYRQLCIVKNPKLFSKDTNLRLALASSCITVIGTAGQAGLNFINKDDILTWNDTSVTPNRSYTFRVVEKNAAYSETQSALLLSYLDNKIPPSGAIFSKPGAAFSSTSLILPDVNKFSGDLLTIDNRLKFSPSTQQIVVLTNSITF